MLVSDATVLAGRALDPVTEAAVALANGRIVAVGDTGAAPGDTVVDASGLLLIPGFIDSHVHIGLADPAAVLRRGVTTVRDLGWPEEIVFGLARASRSPAFDGPLILAAGPMLTAPGGYPTRAAWAPDGTGLAVADPDEAVAAVTRLATAGASVIKIALNPPAGPTLESSVLSAIARTAHSFSLKVTGHIHGLRELDRALDAGVDELAHMLMGEEVLPDPVVERMAGAGTVIVPTLSVRRGEDRTIAVSNLARFRVAGGRAVYGTDLGNEGPRPGIDPLEVQAMAAAGYSAREIVASATAHAAAHLGLERKGSIAPGMDADLVAVPGAALDDPMNLCDVRMVWREGRRVV